MANGSVPRSDSSCSASYVGETKHPLKARVSQHTRPSYADTYDSAVYTHTQQTGHTISMDDVTILEREERWHERGVKEAIYERLEKPDLNKQDCSDVKKRGYNTSGIYVIHPTGTEYSASVYCEITTTDVWTVIQRRYDGNVPFSKTWKQYKSGFGSLKREFWLGNEVVHDLTSQRKYSLRVEMYDLAGMLWTADYTDFSISDEASFYRLYVTGYTGNSSDSLADSNGMAFSTEDKDNDLSSTHCGLYYTAGWWYRHCHYCNLNGRYNVGVIWFDEVKNDWVQMARTMMKIRPKHDD